MTFEVTKSCTSPMDTGNRISICRSYRIENGTSLIAFQLNPENLGRNTSTVDSKTVQIFSAINYPNSDRYHRHKATP